MYTLGGGVDPERGWGHRNETWHAKEELAHYGVQPDWFGLGDRDLATHLVRSQMLRAGYPLSQVTAALCDRWQPGARLLPVSDDRCETHVVITDPDDDSQRAIHFQEWWVRYRAQLPTHSFAFVGAEKANATTEATDAIADADVVLIAPSNPVVSVGAILAVPGIRAALRSTGAPVVGYSPIIDGKPLRGMADECLKVDRRGVDRGGGRPVSRRASRNRNPGLLADPRGRSRRDRRHSCAIGAAADDRSERPRPRWSAPDWTLRAWQRDHLAHRRRRARHRVADRDPAGDRASRIPSRRRSRRGARGCGALAARRRRPGGHQQGAVQVRGPPGARARRPRSARRVAPQARRRRIRPRTCP